MAKKFDVLRKRMSPEARQKVADKVSKLVGYVISADGKSIKCLTCNRTSHSQGDVDNLYCGACQKFHEIVHE